MSLPTQSLRSLIDAHAAHCLLPPWRGYLPGEWLEGLILQESSGNPRARRYEPAHDAAGRYDAASDADVTGKDDGNFEDDASYGLMQVLGTNVRAIMGIPAGSSGVKINFSFLYDPLFAIACGLTILRGELSATAGDVDRALARYNGGPTGDKMVPGPHGALVLRRQEYVDGVARRTEVVHSDRRNG